MSACMLCGSQVCNCRPGCANCAGPTQIERIVALHNETLFKAAARLQLPERCDLAALKTDLEKIADDLLVDISFTELGNQ